MKLKNIIGSLTAKFAALALALTCAGNVWGANVAKIGNTEYPTLAKAVAAVPADGTATTIVMLSDVELSAYVTIAAKQNVTLDLNGKAITTTDSSGDHIYAINNKGKMVLKDSVGTGSISARGVYNATTSATMTIESGTYTALDTSGAAIFNKGKLVVNGGTFNGKTCMCNSGSAAKMTVNGATVNGATVNGVNDYAIKNVSDGTLTINDITVNGVHGSFLQQDGGATTINGGTFAFTGVEGSTTYDVYVKGGSLTIAGGSFLKTGNLDLTDEGSCILHVDSPATATVTGGEFASAAGTAAGLFSGAISVKGGSFEIENGTTADVAGYAAAGYAIVNFSGNTSLYRVFMDNWERPDYADLSWYTANPDASTFEISSAAQFAGLAQLVNGKALNADGTPYGTSGGVTFSKKTITLTADIDLSAHGWVPIGYDFYTKDANVDYATKSFYGTLDGGGHTIKLVLSEQNSIYDDDALFGSVRGGTLKNIVLDATISYPGEISAGYWNPNIYGAASGLVTFITGGVVSNVTMNGSVVMGSRGASGAGLVGYAFYGPKFYDCVNNTSVTIKPYYTTKGSSFVIWGGIVSQITGNGNDPVPAALFTRCVNNATVVMGNPYNNDRMLGGSDNGYGSMNRLSSAGETEFYSCRLHAGGIVGQLASAEYGYLVQLVDCEDNGSIVGGHAEIFDSEGHYSSLYQKGSFYGKVYEGGSSTPVDYSIDTSDEKNKVFYTYDNTYIFNAEEVDLSSCTHHGEGSYYRPSTSSSGKIVQKVGGAEVEVTDADTIASLNNCARLVGPVIKQTSRVVFQTIPNYVAQIGTTKYESLAAAVAAVPTDGTETTITMLAGETIVADAGITIAAGKNIVLDLNGQTVQMTAASADERWLIKNEGSLTVKDSAENGKLLMSATGQASTAVRKSTIKNMGSLTVESGTIELTYSGTTKEEPTTILNDASDRATSLTAKGGTVVNSANRGTGVYLAVNDTNATIVDVQGGRVEGYGSAVRYYFDDRALTDAKLTFSMSNGTIHGRGMYGIHGMTTSSKDWNGISFDISGGTISCVGLLGRKHVISPLQGAVSISGGTFNGDVYIYGHYLNITDGNFNGAVTLHRVKESLASASISGGQFKGALTIAETTNENTTNPYYNAKFVSGGIYGTAPAARNVVDGNVVVDNTDSNTQGDYPKAIGGAVASVVVDENTTYYATLADAIAAANEVGVDEITILNGATESPDTGWKVADGKLVRKVYVAQIGANKYESLAEAVTAATAGATIEIIADDAVSLTGGANAEITINKALTITGAVDESGEPLYTIYGTYDATGSNDIFVTGSGNVTISKVKFAEFGNEKAATDPGSAPIYVSTGYTGEITLDTVTISDFNRGGIFLYGGSFVVTNCYIDCAKDIGSALTKGIEIKGTASGTIVDTLICNMERDSSSSSAGMEIYSNGNIVVDNVTIISDVDDHTTTKATYGIVVNHVGVHDPSGGNLLVTNCSFSCSNGCLAISDGDEGNVLNYSAMVVDCSFDNYVLLSSSGSTITINGGDYAEDLWVDNGAITVLDGEFGNFAPYTEGTGTIAISGGFFDRVVPEMYCAENYMPTTTPDENDMYTVVLKGVAKIGDTYYQTLAESSDAAEAGDTVVLLKDVAEPFALGKDVSITLNLNGNAISVDSGNAISATAGELTITSVVDDEGYATGGVAGAIAVSEGATLNIQGGIYDVDWDDCNIEGTIAVSSVNRYYEDWPTDVEAASALFTSAVPYEYCADGFIPGEGNDVVIESDSHYYYYYYVKEGSYLWKITDADGKVAYSEDVPEALDDEEKEYWEREDWFDENEMNRNGFTMTLLHDVVVDDDSFFSAYVSGLTYTVDLGGHTVNGQMSFGAGKCYATVTNGVVSCAGGTAMSVANGAQVMLADNLVISQSVTGVYVGGGTEADEYSKLTVKEGATISATDAVTVVGSGSDYPVTEVIVEGGTIMGTEFGISGNGTIEDYEDNSNTKITISGGTITGDGVGIYHPQAGTLSVSGGAISGGVAIYAKSGTISVTGGELSANGASGQYDVSYAEDGPQYTGDAFVVDSANYPGGKPTATISGGTFISLNGNGVASYALTGQTTVSNFVSGGYFSQYVTDIYCVSGYLCTTKPVKDELYQVVPAATVTYTLAGGDPEGAALPSPASFAYPSGDMAEIALTPATCTVGGYTFAGWKVSGEGDAISTLPAGTTGDITLVATWTGAKTIEIAPESSTPSATVEIKVTDDWISNNVEKAGETATTEEIQAALEKEDANGLPAWQNYVLGQDPDASVAADAAQGAVDAMPVVSTVTPQTVDTGFKVEYKLVSVDTNGTAVTESALQPTPDLTADIAAMTSETNVVYYKTVAVITSTDNPNVTVEVPSTNTIGVLKVESGAKTTAIAVPWEALGGGDISVSNIVRTATLTPGDELKAYDKTTDKYKVWTLSADKTWEPNLTATSDSTTLADGADLYTVKRGSAVWLTRQNTTQPIYLVGGVAATEKASVALEPKKGDNDPSWNLVGSAGTEPVNVETLLGDNTADKVTVPTATVPKNYEYNTELGKWGYWDSETYEHTNKVGRVSMRVRDVFVTDDNYIPAGTGFWYKNSGTEKQIDL